MARRSTIARPLYVLALLLVAIYGAVGIGVATGSSGVGKASFTPALALDLEGGTQLILTPRTTTGEDITSDDVNQAIAIIRQRVDGSGVAEAEITSQGGQNIVVAIPGEVDDATVDLITQSAQMRMRAVLIESGPGTIDPAALAASEDPTADPSADATAEAGTDATAEAGTDATADATEEPTATPTYTQDQIDEAAFTAADADGDGVLSNTPATTPTDASDQAWVTEQVTYDYLRLDCTLPENRIGGIDDDVDAPLVTCSQDGTSKYVLGPAELTGQDLSSAQMGYKQSSTGMQTNQPIVQLTFTDEGATKFATVTTRLSAQTTPPANQFAIVLDGLVISAPTVNEPIPNGMAEISGPTTNPFTRAEATSLANQLNFGALPLTFEVQSQEQISATLGTEQLQRGMLAGAIGLILVVAYSFLQYRGLGIVTVASLVIAAALTYGVILVLSWTQGYRLSLPGVTGLIVAIGITADSFIVYFERIRDEVREGRSLSAAVEHGWTRARRTILASDAVNFIAAIVLYLLAVGGVRGFAFTLGLTTIIDLVVVMLFTHPLMRLLIKTRFFGGGHKWSGLDPVSLGASVAAYAGRGRVRTPVERKAAVANADTRTIAQRKADAERAAREAAAADAKSTVAGTTASDPDATTADQGATSAGTEPATAPTTEPSTKAPGVVPVPSATDEPEGGSR